jgi:uncharacterized protein (DUF736 family)
MIIGNFTYTLKNDSYAGTVRTVTLPEAKYEFRPVAEPTEKGPSHRVFVKGSANATEVGAAWKRKSAQGREFLSVRLDDPALPRALYAALIPSEDGASAALIWSREKRKAEAEA